MVCVTFANINESEEHMFTN